VFALADEIAHPTGPDLAWVDVDLRLSVGIEEHPASSVFLRKVTLRAGRSRQLYSYSYRGTL